MKAQVFYRRKIKEQDFDRIKVVDLLATKNYPKLSVAVVKRMESGKPGYDSKSDNIYYVLSGKGTTTINGKKHKIAKGDLILIPKGTIYSNSKGLTFLAVSSPMFDRKAQKYVK
jgi:mannose-6-phosphate isomerase-like protein (cupin superfamily)